MHEIAYRRLLYRLFELQPDDWVVKGGAALLLRLDPNRTSNDIDLAYVRQAGEHPVALDALNSAAELDAGDFFTFEVGAGRFVDEDHPLERAFSVPVLARIGEREFARFSIDLALPREDVDSERIDPATSLTGNPAVDSLPEVATLTFAAQVADKACAIYEKHGVEGTHSSRARDLADIGMIAQQVDLDGTRLIERVQIEESRRLAAGTLKSALPDELSLSELQLSDWAGRWDKATRNAPIGFDAALELASALMTPVLDKSADGATWHGASKSWTRDESLST